MAKVKIDSNVLKYKNMSFEQVVKALNKCGLQAERTAKIELTRQLKPKHNKDDYVATGNLRNSITYKVTAFGNQGEMQIGSNVEYAPYVEFGTGIYYEGGRQTPWKYQDANGNWHTTNGMQERPFLRPAIENNMEIFKNIIESTLHGK